MAKRGRFRIEELVAVTAEPLFVLDCERRLLFANEACERLVGQPLDPLRGQLCRYASAAESGGSNDVAASLGPPPQVMFGQPMTVAALFFGSGAAQVRHVHFFPCHDAADRLHAVIGIITPEPAVAPSAPPPDASLHDALVDIRQRLFKRFHFDQVIAASPAMTRALEQARVAAQCDAHVLLWGEKGTGKGLLARAIHGASSRREHSFVPVDCALLPAATLERDLFGADSGVLPARSGASGLVQKVGCGTLFLGNVQGMPRDVQARLARVLDQAARHRGPAPGPRWIAASEVNPSRLLAASELREDLYYRLTALVIEVPPLRDRAEDIALLAQRMLEETNRGGDRQLSGFDPDALDVLRTYDWPGNVPELAEVVRQAHAQCAATVIQADELPARIRGALGGAFATPPGDERIDLESILQDAERKLIDRALRRARGNKSLAADLLSISRPRLYRRMVMLGMDGADSPGDEEHNTE